MNEAPMRKLIAALRSHEYAPGKHALRRTESGVDRFCCLGIACELAVQEGVIPPGVRGYTPFDGDTWYYGGARETSVLPWEVADWLGTDTNPVYNNYHFAAQNDLGASQNELADRFEAWLEADLALQGPTVTSTRAAAPSALS